jgi:hypothetical protein
METREVTHRDLLTPHCAPCGDLCVATSHPEVWECTACDGYRDQRGRRVCGCGCGASLAGYSARTKFIPDSRHRQRKYRRDVKAAAKAAGVRASLTLTALREDDPTTQRDGDAARAPRRRRRSPRSGLSIYLPTLVDAELLHRWISGLRSTDQGAAAELQAAEHALDAAITRRRKKETRV